MPILYKFREKLKIMLTLDRPPSVIAKASAFGVLIGISPYIGLQTYIAILVSGWLSLPIYPLLIGVYITNPITIPFIYSLTTKFGVIILNMENSVHFDWDNITVSSILEVGKTLMLPFFVGTHIIGIILSIVTYFLTLYLVKRYRHNQQSVGLFREG